MTSEPIKGFGGDFRWLSNFWVASVVYEGCWYESTEAAYQAAKTLDLELRKQFQSGSGITCGLAKRLGQKLEIRPDWEEVKQQVMYDVCLDKFTRHEDLKELLLMTEFVYLEETNHWNDTYWGVCNGEGDNMLGKILMMIRSYLRCPKSHDVDVEYFRQYVFRALGVPVEFVK